ncbi:UNVERIFIED_CONTAM: hypothetical protein GTU68_018170 [Idotea baltica]|nr:hypothetical protein [Idotea baltica]
MAQAFVAKGSRVMLVDRDSAVAEAAKSLGDNAFALCRDVTPDDAGSQVVASALDVFGRLDVVVNNAGIGPLAPAEDFTTELWDATIGLNLRAAFLMARAAAKPMLAAGIGRIINIASQAATVGIEGHVAYCSSKAGLLGMTRCMALEWGRNGITVNAISPTVVETELGLSGWAGEKGEKARREIPVGRFARPDEIAEAAVFLASSKAAMINGVDFKIDGGYTIR